MLVTVGFDCTSVMMQNINVFVFNPTTSFRDFHGIFERDTGGISIIDMSVPNKSAFNVTYGETVCYLTLHMQNLGHEFCQKTSIRLYE